MLESPRCGAKTRSAGACMSPGVRDKKRCRMHGGAKGSGASRGNQNAFKHGRYRGEAMEERALLAESIKDVAKTVSDANEFLDDVGRRTGNKGAR